MKRKNIFMYCIIVLIFIITLINLRWWFQFKNISYMQVSYEEELFHPIYTKYTNRTVYDYFEINLLINCSTKCDINEVYDVVFLVKTRLNSLDRRNSIRETWGSETRADNYKFKTVFVMGIDYSNHRILEKVIKENYIYKDIIIGEFQDTYRNNSIKAIIALHWVKTYCFNSKFYIIADDDAYYNTINLMNYLNAVSRQKKYVPNLRYFGGAMLPNMPPFRKGKYAVSLEEYPRSVYPNYVNGHAMIMSKQVVKDFLFVSKYTMIDDVYFGLLAETAGIRVWNIPHSSASHPGSNVILFNDIITSHYIPNANELRRIWNEQKKRGNA